MAIDITFIADTSRAIADAKKFGDSLDSVADELDKLEEAGDKAGRKLEDSLDEAGDAAKDMGREAERAGENVEDALKEAGSEADRLDKRMSDAFRNAGKASSDAGKKIGDDTRKGFDKAGEGLDEFKSEANSTARESAASFDGSAESIGDSFQEVAANAFAGFGPAGALAGLAIAAGIGTAIAKMQELAEANTEAQEGVADLAGQYSDLGGVMDANSMADRIKDWGREVLEDNWLTFWVDESETNFQRIAEIAKEAGVDVGDAIRGMKGSVEDSEGFLEGTEDEWRRLTEQIDAGTTVLADGTTWLDKGAQAAKDKRDALDELRGGSQRNKEAHEEAIDIYGIEQEALGESTEAQEEAADATRDHAEAKLELVDAAKGTIEAEMELVEALQAGHDAAIENGEATDLNTEAGRNNMNALLELVDAQNGKIEADARAGGSVGTLTGDFNNNRSALMELAQSMGYSEGEARKLADRLLKHPKDVKTTVEADTKPAHNDIDALESRKPRVTAYVWADTTDAVTKIDSLNGRRVTVQADAFTRLGGKYAP